MTWRFSNAEGTVVHRTNQDGSSESRLTEAIADWIAAGNTVLPYSPSAEAILSAQLKAAEVADTIAARQYAKLNNLKALSPAQVQTWVANNINTIADVKEALTTLAIAVSILSRRL